MTHRQTRVAECYIFEAPNSPLERCPADHSTEAVWRYRVGAKFLFVGHNEHAVPADWRLIKEIVLTALPVNT